MDIIFDQFILNRAFLEWISCEHLDSFKAYERINQLQENLLENLRQGFEYIGVYSVGVLFLRKTIQNFNKPMESKTDVPGITITYFQPKTNITVNRENIYMGAKRTNDIPNYGAQVEFIIKDLVWLVFILIVVILVTCIYHEPLLKNFRGMS